MIAIAIIAGVVAATAAVTQAIEWLTSPRRGWAWPDTPKDPPSPPVWMRASVRDGGKV